MVTGLDIPCIALLGILNVSQQNVQQHSDLMTLDQPRILEAPDHNDTPSRYVQPMRWRPYLKAAQVQ